MSSTGGAHLWYKGKWTDTRNHIHTHTQKKKPCKSGSERIARALAFHFPARQGNCTTIPEPHNVTLSLGKRVGAGRDDGEGGGLESGMKEETQTHTHTHTHTHTY